MQEKQNELTVGNAPIVRSSTDIIMNDTSYRAFKNQCDMLAKSGMVPRALQNKPYDIFAILMTAYELNIPQMQAINGINVIQGKPVVSPQLMLALIRSRYPDVEINFETGDDYVSCEMKREGNIATSRWDVARATRMQLMSKDNYKKQPLNMFKWRAAGDCARELFSDVLSGLYLPAEIEPTREKVSIDGNGDVIEIGKVVKSGDIKEGSQAGARISPIEILLKNLKDILRKKTNEFKDTEKLKELYQHLGINGWDDLEEKSWETLKEMIESLEKKNKEENNGEAKSAGN